MNNNSTLNYAEKYQPKLLEMYIENSYIAPFIASNVEWLDAKTFHFTTLKVGGYKQHKLTGGWNRQKFEENDHPYTVENDRDVEFFVDKREVDETNRTASIENISNVFTMTQAIPESDAYFFSKVATKAIALQRASTSVEGDWTKANVITKLKEIIRKNRRYANKGLILYVQGFIMDLISLSTEYNRNINVERLSSSTKGLETRITVIDGVPIVEVIDDERFYTAFDFTDGFELTETSKKINVLAATPMTTKYVEKISSIYLFLAGEHTQGDGPLYQNRDLNDVFMFPNAKNDKIDSIYVDYDETPINLDSDDGDDGDDDPTPETTPETTP